MNLLFPDEGLVAQIKYSLNQTPTWRLFVNNVVPTLNTVKASLTEAAWTGYAAVPLDFTNFTLNGVAGHNGYAIAPPISFTNGTGAPVIAYGYFVLDPSAVFLLAVALFDAGPLTIAPAGVLQVVPIWGDFSGFSA